MIGPTSCDICRRTFATRFLLQSEAAHLAATVGAGSAKAFVNDELAEDHALHTEDAYECGPGRPCPPRAHDHNPTEIP